MITHPLILIALVAVTIPIAVHLFNFRRYKKIYFSNVDYLTALQQQTRKQSELMRYLILASRILAIVCLVLAFAQPVIPGSGKPLKTGGTAVSIYLDNSFSMDNTNSDGTLLEMGRTKVREIVAAYDVDDQFQLITNQASGSQFRWISKDELLDELDEVRVHPATIMMSEMGRRQQDFLRGSHAANQHCYVISDFQKSTADLDQWQVDTNIQTTMLALGGTAISNLYIDSVALNAPVYYAGNSLAATVYLKNSGKENLDQVQVKLYANEAQRAVATVDVPAEGHAEVMMHMKVDDAKLLQCRVEVVDYPVTFDDKFYFSVNVNSSISVLNIGADNVYLDRLFDADSSIRYTKSDEQHIDYERLDANNLIILDEPAVISSGLAQSLHDWVEAGGTLLVVPNDKMHESYNAALAIWHAPQLGAWVQHRTAVTAVDVEHGLYRNVFGGKTDDLELPTLQAHYQLNTTAGGARTSVLTMADGSDYLTATPLGGGVVYLLASPLRDQYSDWMRQALFVPTLYNMALYSRQMTNPYYMLGQSDMIALNNSYSLPHLTNTAGEDQVLTIRQVAGRCYAVTYGALVESGNYKVGEGDLEEGVSFNYSRKESLMDCYAPAEVKSLIADNHLANCSVVPNAQKSIENYIRQQRSETPLWRWFVVGCLLFLLIEILLLRKSRKVKTDVKS